MAGSKQLIELLVLDPADFPPLPLQPGFAQLVQDELGDVATPADGFDEVLAGAVGIVDALDAALGDLGGGLLDAFAEADLVDPAAAGDNLVAGNAAVVAVVQFPGGIGFGQLVTEFVQLRNVGATPFTVRSVLSAPNTPTVWTVTPDVTGMVFPPGSSVTLTISVRAEPGNWSGTFTVNTDRPDPQPCIMWSAQFTTPPAVGGGAPAPGSGLLTLRGSGGPSGFGPNA